MARKRKQSERVLVTLPHDLVGQLRKYAEQVRDGNNSGFVADAVRMYIDHLRKQQRTAKLRAAYAAAAQHSRKVGQAWQAADDALWTNLEAAPESGPLHRKT